MVKQKSKVATARQYAYIVIVITTTMQQCGEILARIDVVLFKFTEHTASVLNQN